MVDAEDEELRRMGMASSRVILAPGPADLMLSGEVYLHIVLRRLG